MNDSSKACYKCGKVGHFAWACHFNGKKRDAPGSSNSSSYPPEKPQDSIKSKVTRCFVCRKLGHLARSCPTSSGTGVPGKYYDLDRPMENKRLDEDDDAPPPPTLGNFSGYDVDDNVLTQALDSIEERGWDFIKNDSEAPPKQLMKHLPKEDKYYKSVFLSNTKFTGYLDTCSEKCLIKYSAAKRAHLNVQLDDTDVMLNSPSFKSKIVSIGKALTTVDVDNVEITNVEMYIVSDDVLNVEVVIGRSWLDHPQVVMVKLDNTVYVVNMNEIQVDKLRAMVTPPKAHLDIITSDEELARNNENNKRMSPKRSRHHSRTKNNDSPSTSPRKSHMIFERPRRSLSRDRSRSRERMRDSSRDNRLGKNSRRSRERSRERYMRHGPRR